MWLPMTSRAPLNSSPLSFWPHHTVAHVMEMNGRPEDGLGWMAARDALWSTPGHMNQSIFGGARHCFTSNSLGTRFGRRCQSAVGPQHGVFERLDAQRRG